MGINFSKWVHIKSQKILLERAGHHCPGVYAIAYSSQNLHNNDFDFIQDIIYFGMSVSKKYLRGRLYQFFRGIYSNCKEHGAAYRMKHELNNEDNEWIDKMYISLKPFPHCGSRTLSPNDLLYMGDVAKEEYVCLSKYLELFNKLPRFNEKAFFRKKKES